MVKDWGPQKVRDVLERELEAPLPDGPAPVPAPIARRDHLGLMAQRDGLVSWGSRPRRVHHGSRAA